MKKKLLFTLLVLVSFGFTFNVSAQTKKENERWFKNQEWLGGLKLQPHSSVDVQEFAKQYHANQKYFDEAFAFMKNHDLNKLAPGNYPIDGQNVYAIVTYDSTKDFDKSKWESHKKYIDLQYVISGEEKIGVAPVSGLTVTEPYSDKKDIAHYSGPGKLYDAKPGTFFLFFPGTGHRPGITTNNNQRDRKIVIKIKSM